MLLLLALLAGGLYWGATTGIQAVRDRFSEAEDYPGPGRGSVLVEVEEGDTSTDIGRSLVDKDVVASLEAFTDAARAASPKIWTWRSQRPGMRARPAPSISSLHGGSRRPIAAIRPSSMRTLSPARPSTSTLRRVSGLTTPVPGRTPPRRPPRNLPWPHPPARRRRPPTRAVRPRPQQGR